MNPDFVTISLPQQWFLLADSSVTPERACELSSKSISDAASGAMPISLNEEGYVNLVEITHLSDSEWSLDKRGKKILQGKHAVLLAEVNAPTDGKVLATGGADFFWAIYCNGVPCFDLLEHGNGGTPVTATDKVFSFPVHAGKNTLAFFVKCGMCGWAAAIAFPELLPQNLRRFSRRREFLNAFPPVPELRYGPWLTHARNGEVAVRFTTPSPIAVAVEYAPVGTEDWERRYEIWNGYYRWDTEYHAVILDKLLPATDYQFRILLFPEDESKDGHLPEPLQKAHVIPDLYTFRSAPAPDAGFRFFVMSDTHLPNASRKAMLQQYDHSYHLASADFFAHLGDSSSSLEYFDDELLGGFTDFFNKDNRLQPICLVHGNHEYSGREGHLWNLCFSDPKTGLSYCAFRYGIAFFLVFDYWTGREIDTPPSNRKQHFISQEDWARAVIQSEECKTATYRIALNHCPPQNPSREQTCVICANFFQTLFDTIPFHLVLGGHLHKYLHQNLHGVDILTLDGGERAKEVNITQVDVTPEAIHIRSGKEDGTIFDSFDILPSDKV
ncbi:MAG: hypothetical protein IJJ26_13565 [Victivallales bacterium]|nr:hypothetical protein [Victivallales bacterium]